MDPVDRQLLLVEPHQLVRSTVAAVARDLRLARIEQATSVEAAGQRMRLARYHALVLALDDTDAALALLARLRAGELASSADIPVIALASGCSAELARQLKTHQVRRLLLKPFKVKLLLESIEGLWVGSEETQAV